MSPRLVVDNTAPPQPPPAEPAQELFGFCVTPDGIYAVHNGKQISASAALLALADCVRRLNDAAEARAIAALSTPGSMR